MSNCNSIFTVSDSANTCTQCGTLAEQNIELAYMEVNGSTLKIWIKVLNINDYSSVVNRINFFNIEVLGVFGSSPSGASSLVANVFHSSESNNLSKYVFVIINFNNSHVSCPLEPNFSEFHDDLCDISYSSNKIYISCDNDNDGFLILDDCNDNNRTQYAGATEYCDDIDNDCNGTTDENCIDISGVSCPFELNVFQTDVIAGTYNADHHINTQGTVNPNANCSL